MREIRSGSWFSRLTPVVRVTMVTLLAIFIVSALAVRFSDAARVAFGYLALDPELVIRERRVWTLVTYSLLHTLDSPFHLLFNGLAFYFFGPTMESRWGSRRFALFMLIAAFVGGLFVLGTYLVGLGGTPVIGASAITMALLIAWGFTFPDREVYFFFFPLKGIHLIYLTIAIEILNAVSLSGSSASAHFGGIAVGFFYGESSPIRRALLQLKLKRLQAQSASLRGSGATPAKRRAGGPDLRIVHGGQKDSPPKDKRYLN